MLFSGSFPSGAEHPAKNPNKDKDNNLINSPLDNWRSLGVLVIPSVITRSLNQEGRKCKNFKKRRNKRAKYEVFGVF